MKQMKEGVIVISERRSNIKIKGILKDALLSNILCGLVFCSLVSWLKDESPCMDSEHPFEPEPKMP